MKVKLSDIIEAIETAGEYSENFLDCETGEIVWINDMVMDRDEIEEASEKLDEHGFYRLPNSFEIHEYNMLEEFTFSLPEPARSRLEDAIRGKGAFRRFRDTIRQLGVADQWYEFRSSGYRQKAIEWCIENNLEYEE